MDRFTWEVLEGGGVVFGAPVVSAEVIWMPAHAAVGTVDELNGDEFGFVPGVDGEVGEVVVSAGGGVGFDTAVLFDFAGLRDDLSSGFSLGVISFGDVSDGQEGWKPGPVDLSFDSLFGVLLGEDFSLPDFQCSGVDFCLVEFFSYFVDLGNELMFFL